MKKTLKIISASFILYGIILSTSVTSAEKLFPDVPEDAWFTQYVNETAKTGLMEGYPDGRFGSWDPINRAEFAKVILELKSQLKESWWKKHLFEVILALITLFGWIRMTKKLKKLDHSNVKMNKKLDKEASQAGNKKNTEDSEKYINNWWNK